MNRVTITIRRVLGWITFERYFASRLNVGVAHRLAEYNYNYSKFLITLSSSAVALSFAILQLVKFTLKHEVVLKVGWCFFGLTILFGILFHILDIIRAFLHARAELILGDGKNLQSDEQTTFFRKLNDQMSSVDAARFSYLALLLQSMSFFCAVGCLMFVIIDNF